MPALLFTKFFLPTPRYKQVARSSILAVLTDGFQQGRPLTLVSAPAGYGKSVAVAEWLSSAAGVRICWLSLDEADNEPGRFFHQFCGGLTPAG